MSFEGDVEVNDEELPWAINVLDEICNEVDLVLGKKLKKVAAYNAALLNKSLDTIDDDSLDITDELKVKESAINTKYISCEDELLKNTTQIDQSLIIGKNIKKQGAVNEAPSKKSLHKTDTICVDLTDDSETKESENITKCIDHEKSPEQPIEIDETTLIGKFIIGIHKSDDSHQAKGNVDLSMNKGNVNDMNLLITKKLNIADNVPANTVKEFVKHTPSPSRRTYQNESVHESLFPETDQVQTDDVPESVTELENTLKKLTKQFHKLEKKDKKRRKKRKRRKRSSDKDRRSYDSNEDDCSIQTYNHNDSDKIIHHRQSHDEASTDHDHSENSKRRFSSKERQSRSECNDDQKYDRNFDEFEDDIISSELICPPTPPRITDCRSQSECSGNQKYDRNFDDIENRNFTDNAYLQDGFISSKLVCPPTNPGNNNCQSLVVWKSRNKGDSSFDHSDNELFPVSVDEDRKSTDFGEEAEGINECQTLVLWDKNQNESDDDVYLVQSEDSDDGDRQVWLEGRRSSSIRRDTSYSSRKEVEYYDRRKKRDERYNSERYDRYDRRDDRHDRRDDRYDRQDDRYSRRDDRYDRDEDDRYGRWDNRYDRNGDDRYDRRDDDRSSSSRHYYGSRSRSPVGYRSEFHSRHRDSRATDKSRRSRHRSSERSEFRSSSGQDSNRHYEKFKNVTSEHKKDFMDRTTREFLKKKNEEAIKSLIEINTGRTVSTQSVGHWQSSRSVNQGVVITELNEESKPWIPEIPQWPRQQTITLSCTVTTPYNGNVMYPPQQGRVVSNVINVFTSYPPFPH